ncbi:MAG: chorismate synthase [Spirochaetales bacterium]|uniref:Chorismate synthase n=1 Tax=Candidatus Thalassospirochaeta sargassi TaxID=3119039 RepID=A0AAJ1IHS1_9SPIO|nr:chorismate synthase [Spirochaetales bacterium]
MPGNSFGSAFRITTFGESHGTAVGVIIDGVIPGVEISEEYIQIEMNRRKPGQSSVTTPRKESDRISIVSGTFEGKTTGTPLTIILYNHDANPDAYSNIKDFFRPGHADFTYLQKYGIRDHRGSGRASGRETAGRVAAGAVAKKLLESEGVFIKAYTLEAAGIRCETIDLSVVEDNPMRAADPAAAWKMTEKVTGLAEKGDSAGGIVECLIQGIPAGIGEPVFDKIDADISKGVMSLGGVKGIEFGAGFGAAKMLGSEHNDWMGKNGFETNNAGGILGGITTGEDIKFRIAVKPTSSIEHPQKTIDVNGEETEIITTGRHDPCLTPRIVPVVESMAAIVIIDHLLRHRAQTSG